MACTYACILALWGVLDGGTASNGILLRYVSLVFLYC